jgi:hypothetical protein
MVSPLRGAKKFPAASSAPLLLAYFLLLSIVPAPASVFLKEMDSAEFVKVIPVVLFIIERLSRPVKQPRPAHPIFWTFSSAFRRKYFPA